MRSTPYKGDNCEMIIPFTKMQGAGNDFVVIDETNIRYPLRAKHYRLLADRHFGVGADQILSVRPPPYEGVDFEYVIHNADGGEVEHCGNGARCFVRFVQDSGLTNKNPIRVKIRKGEIELEALPDGRVRVDMGAPEFELSEIPFNAQFATKLNTKAQNLHGALEQWQLNNLERFDHPPLSVLSMGNPHAVLFVNDLEHAPVHELGALIEHHPAFPNRVNVGFVQVIAKDQIKLRVFERGAGETLACGSGACAAVVAGISRGLLSNYVNVQTSGGELSVAWQGLNAQGLVLGNLERASVMMTGPAKSVFKGEIKIDE